MAIGKVNVSNGIAEALIEFDNYISDNNINGDTSKMVLELPIGTKYKFSEQLEEQIAEKSSILVNSPATGYIKLKNGIIFNKERVPASILFSATEGDNTLHLRNQDDGFDCTIDWGDGSTTVVPPNGGNVDHSYATAGDYNIQISGKSFAGFYVNGETGKEKYKALYSMGEWEIDTMTDINYAFACCTGLTTLPADLFKYNTLVTDMSGVFYDCTNLSIIPADLFKYNTLVTNMNGVFDECTSLTEIPLDLFKYNTSVTDMSSVFYGCTGLIEIPVDLFKYNTAVITMYSCFENCTSLTEIPADLFRYNTLVIDISNVFYGCTGLTTIPADLFRYNTLVTDMSGVFSNCTNLSIIPADLFKYNTLITKAEGPFSNCVKLTLCSDIFGEDYETRFNGKTVDFSDCFYRESFNGVQGVAPALWNFTGLISTKTGCFGGTGNNAASLTNYADIPVDWK